MSDTPRTDEECWPDAEDCNPESGEVVDADFCRQLERELNAANDEIERHAWKISPAMAQAKIDQLNAEIAKLRAQLASGKGGE